MKWNISKSYTEYLRHIFDECNFIITVVPQGFTKEEFLNDDILKRAVVRSLEIIGEASKQIPADIKLQWSKVEWKSMAGMRDKLIHDYMGINYIIVWDVVKNKIPSLSDQIAKVIQEYE